MASTANEPAHLIDNLPPNRPLLSTKPSTSSGSDEEEGLHLDTAHAISSVVPAESCIGLSISPVQSRLASAKTPAIEKAAAINNGDGYFLLDAQLEALNEVDNLTPSELESTERYQNQNNGSLSLQNIPTQRDDYRLNYLHQIREAAQASTMRVGTDDLFMDRRRSQRPPLGEFTLFLHVVQPEYDLL
jgi:hypothetical protein